VVAPLRQAPSRVLIGGEQTPEGLAAIATLVNVYANWVGASHSLLSCLSDLVEG
jgi:UDPglucose 6-dehydrogenase